MFKRNIGFFAFLLVMLAGLGVGEANAQAPLKIGYTDHEIIIANMPRSQEIQQQLQREYQQGQQELQTTYAAYQEKVENYQKQQALLSAETRQQREQELMQEQQTLQAAAAQKEQALQQRQAELLQPLYGQVEQAIQEVAQEQSIDLVIRSQVGAGSEPIILYVNEERIVDITEDVARKLGINVDAEPTAATAPAPVAGPGN